MAKECDLRGKLGKALFSVFEAFNFDLIIHRLLRPVELFCPKCPECAQLLESCLTLQPYRVSTGFSRQAYWNGLSYPPPADPPDSGMEPVPPATNALGRFLTYWATRAAHMFNTLSLSNWCKYGLTVSWIQILNLCWSLQKSYMSLQSNNHSISTIVKWLDGITAAVDMNSGNLWETVRDREA